MQLSGIDLGVQRGFPLKTCGNDMVATNNFSATNSEPLHFDQKLVDN
jgi:hypothetical protein